MKDWINYSKSGRGLDKKCFAHVAQLVEQLHGKE